MVIGPQQHFLQDLQQKMWYEGDIMRMRPSQQIMTNHHNHTHHHRNHNGHSHIKGDRSKVNILPGIKSLSVGEFYDPNSDAVKGRKGQADGLLERRAKHGHGQQDVRQI